MRTSMCVQVSIGHLEAFLLDTSSGVEVIPSLSVAACNVQVNFTTDAAITVPTYQASSLVTMPEGTKLAMDLHATLACRYFNSSLHVEESMITVRAAGHQLLA
jgi:hypothetical protein